MLISAVLGILEGTARGLLGSYGQNAGPDGLESVFFAALVVCGGVLGVAGALLAARQRLAQSSGGLRTEAAFWAEPIDAVGTLRRRLLISQPNVTGGSNDEYQLTGFQQSLAGRGFERVRPDGEWLPDSDAEEEKALAERFYYENDLEAARKLVLCHLRFVVHLARSYAGYGLSHGDLIQEGNVGLMKAVKRYNPEVGVRLVSFAVHWIKAEMHEFILRNWRIVKVATTKAQRKLFFNLRSNKNKLGWLNQAETEAVARDLGVSPEVVTQMEGRLSAHDMAFDGESDDDDEAWTAPSQYLEATGADPAEVVADRRTVVDSRAIA